MENETESILCHTCHYITYMPDIKYSRHARMRMVERGISVREVRDTILKGSKRAQGNKIVSAHKHLEIVFRKLDDGYYVITVMLRW
jgi:hypothetical protein